MEASTDTPDLRSQDPTLTLHDRWGDTEAPLDQSTTMQEELETDRRLWELSEESHKKVISALTTFTERPYFTRLWVRLIMT